MTADIIGGVGSNEMSYVFNVPPPTGFIWLLLVIYRSTYSPLIIFFFLLGLNALANKLQNKFFTAIATILALGVTALPTVYWLRPGSVTAFQLAVAMTMTIAVFALNFVKFTVLDYAVLFSCFAFITRFHGVSQPLTQGAVLFGVSSPVLFVFVVLLVLYKIRLKVLRGSVFYCWFTFVITFIYGYAASNLFVRYIVPISQAHSTWAASIRVWALVLLAVAVVSAIIFHIMKWLLKKHFDNINRMGKAYPQIERFFIYNSVGILVFMAFFHSIYGQIEVYIDPVTHALSVTQNPFFERSDLFLLFAMVLQVSFLIMVFRMTWLKDNLHNKAMESQNLAAYSSSLEKNMNDIKHIKHDIKNIFLTMGNFVAQSGNAEMQDFYNTKIAPFAGDEMAKSDLYGRLAGIGNEQLKAFMFYKISQALERDVHVGLDVSLSHFETDMEFVDLVRVLGILLDNAIEECMEIPGGGVGIKISQNHEMVSVVIKNDVRQEIREQGVRPGVSTKGEGRGKGLATVRRIVEMYDFVALNSYFKGDCFVQSVAIYVKNLVDA